MVFERAGVFPLFRSHLPNPGPVEGRLVRFVLAQDPATRDRHTLDDVQRDEALDGLY